MVEGCSQRTSGPVNADSGLTEVNNGHIKEQPPKCDHSPADDRDVLTPDYDAVPYLFIHRTPAYSTSLEKEVYGLVCAVWSDGHVLRVTTADTVGRSYVYGTMKPDALPALIELVETVLALVP
jgi:hypothetical protein